MSGEMSIVIYKQPLAPAEFIKSEATKKSIIPYVPPMAPMDFIRSVVLKERIEKIRDVEESLNWMALGHSISVSFNRWNISYKKNANFLIRKFSFNPRAEF